MTPHHDPIEAFTRGDRLRAELLRRNLETIRERSDDPHLRRVVGEVLEGRRGMRELVRDPAFERELDRGMEGLSEHWESLSPEERAALVRDGQDAAARERARLGLEPEDEPPAQVGDSPLLRS